MDQSSFDEYLFFCSMYVCAFFLQSLISSAVSCSTNCCAVQVCGSLLECIGKDLDNILDRTDATFKMTLDIET